MRYLVTARVRPGREAELLRAIEDGTLGEGSVAGDEYLRNIQEARLMADGKVKWVEVCFCATPLEEAFSRAGLSIVKDFLLFHMEELEGWKSRSPRSTSKNRPERVGCGTNSQSGTAPCSISGSRR